MAPASISLEIFKGRNNRDSKKALWADKLACRDLIRGLVGEDALIKIYGSWDSFDQIDFDQLPDCFALKCNHGCGWNVLVSNKETIDYDALRHDFDTWLSKDYAFCTGFEMHYSGISRKVFAEELIKQESPLMEYQAWCFNGNPRFISVINEPHGCNEKITYDTDWNHLGFVTSLPRMAIDVERPQALDKMLEASQQISNDFVFTRVDWYITEAGRLLFSEVTFTPASGVCKWDPPEMDQKLGDMLLLPEV